MIWRANGWGVLQKDLVSNSTAWKVIIKKSTQISSDSGALIMCGLKFDLPSTSLRSCAAFG